MDTLSLQQQFITAISSTGDIQSLQTIYSQSPGTEADKKAILEQSFRTVLTQLITSDSMDFAPCARLVELAISAAEIGIALYTVPFYLMADMFESFTLDICEQVFSFVENHVATWKSKEFYTSGKILLLRMCNDLLRRLSSAQNTVFCGRIQLFLARLFPLSEKSALNLMSHFNQENITTYTKDAGMSADDIDEQEDMEVDGASQKPSATPIDFNLYHKLWSIQDAFRLPTQVFTADFWKTFTANVQEVLGAFSSFKLEDTTQFSKSPQKQLKNRSVSMSEYTESHYFAKFLTSEKLMNLQLQDSHFRRHILVQLLVLFQYLTTDTKFKSSSHTLPDSGAQWVKETSAQVYKLLEETPPKGAEFAAYIKQMLEREEAWIVWKNEGCPSFEKAPPSNKETTPYFKREHVGDTVDSPIIDMGSRELTRLWNLCPDNLEACKKKSRDFVPDLKSFIEEPIIQADPEAQIEAEYKLINNPNFTWRALRLLAQSSPHFFQNTTAQIKEIPVFLEAVMIQTGKDFQLENSPTEQK